MVSHTNVTEVCLDRDKSILNKLTKFTQSQHENSDVNKSNAEICHKAINNFFIILYTLNTHDILVKLQGVSK